MKKIVTILLLFIYTASITGVGVKAFYCCNKLTSVSAMVLLDRSVSSDKQKNEPGCCNTKYSFFKIKDNHKAASGSDAPPQPVTDVLPYTSHPLVYNGFYGDIQVAHRSNAPPPPESQPAYKMNCVYRI